MRHFACLATSLAAVLLLSACVATVPETRPAASTPTGASAPSSQVAAGRAAYDKGRDTEALALLLPLAEAGDRSAQFLVGRIYVRDRGVPPDPARSVAWYERAAAQGSAPAASNAGLAYKHGRGVPVDLAKAATYFRTSADAGLAHGAYNLGLLYEHGQGLPRDLPQAVRWYQAALAAKDHADLGTDVLIQIRRRVELGQFQIRADQGDPNAMMELADWLSGGGSHLGRDMAKATRLRIAAADKGHAPAQTMAGEAYLLGMGVQSDPRRAARYFESAARQGHAPAMVRLAHVNAGGLAGKRDLAQARKWLQAAVDLNDADAMGEMAAAHEQGMYGLPRDAAKAREWREREARQRSADEARRTR